MTAEEFWLILFGEEAFALRDWGEKYQNVDCIITPSRFREALVRINKFLEEFNREARISQSSWTDQ